MDGGVQGEVVVLELSTRCGGGSGLRCIAPHVPGIAPCAHMKQNVPREIGWTLQDESTAQ